MNADALAAREREDIARTLDALVTELVASGAIRQDQVPQSIADWMGKRRRLLAQLKLMGVSAP